jgi:hypothetical protein
VLEDAASYAMRLEEGGLEEVAGVPVGVDCCTGLTEVELLDFFKLLKKFDIEPLPVTLFLRLRISPGFDVGAAG